MLLKSLRSTSFAICLLFVSSSLFAQESATKQINDVFNSYSKAILKGDASAAIDLVDKNTINYYNGLMKDVLGADKKSIQEMGLLKQITILWARASIKSPLLQTMTGTDLYKYAVSNEMISNDILGSLKLGEPEINGNNASVQISRNKMDLPGKLKFTNEEGIWKIDGTSLFSMTENGLNTVRKMLNLDKTQYVRDLVTKTTGKEISEDIYKPLKK